jgi:predicted PurR-regulated permease PerM
MRVLFTVLLCLLGLSFLYVARHTLIAFLFAILFAYLIDPAVSRVEKWTHGRGRAIAIIYVLLLGLLALFFMSVGPKIAHQAQRLSEALPTVLEKVNSGQIAEQIGAEHGWSLHTREQLKSFLANHRGQLVQLAQRLGVWVAELAPRIWLLVLIPILAIFFLRDGRTFSEVLLSFVHTRPQREFLGGVLADLNEMLAHFIRAQLTLTALSLLAYVSYLSLAKAPYPLVLGTVGGVLEFIPVVGPLVAAVLLIGVSLLMGYSHWIGLLIFLGSWRLIQDYVVSPRILGHSTELHPLAALFGILAGGEIAGVLGVYLSIPVMASLRILWRRWRLYAEKKRFGPLSDFSYTEVTRGE